MNTRFKATQLCKNVIALKFALLAIERFINTKKLWNLLESIPRPTDLVALTQL